jgi:hypothetical protein
MPDARIRSSIGTRKAICAECAQQTRLRGQLGDPKATGSSGIEKRDRPSPNAPADWLTIPQRA